MVSLACALFVTLTTPIWFNGDSLQYLRNAWKVTGEWHGEYYYYRTPGLSLLMLLTGVTIFKSLKGLIVVQILMAAFTPLLTLRAFESFGNRIARAVAITTVLSFVPFRYVNYVMTDHAAIFLQVASIVAFAHYLQRPTLVSILVITLLALGSVLFRPSAGAMIIIAWLILAVYKPHQWRHIFLSVMLFSLLGAGVSLIRAYELNPPGRWNYVARVGECSGMGGRMLFWNVYSTARSICHNDQLVAEENGPATARMVHLLRSWLDERPEKLGEYSPTDTDNESFLNAIRSANSYTDRRAFANDLLAKTTLLNHWEMWLILDEMIGPVEADDLFRASAYEAFRRHPEALLYVWDGVIDFFGRFDVTYNGGERVELTPLSYEMPQTAYDPFTQRSAPPPGFASKATGSVVKGIWRGVFVWQFVFKIVAAMVLLITMPFWLRNENAALPVYCAGLAVYQAVVSVAFAAPHVRYIDPVIPLITAVAVVGLGNLATRCGRTEQKGAPTSV